eukprot:3552364-Prymnesium_polylepis.2
MMLSRDLSQGLDRFTNLRVLDLSGNKAFVPGSGLLVRSDLSKWWENLLRGLTSLPLEELYLASIGLYKHLINRAVDRTTVRKRAHLSGRAIAASKHKLRVVACAAGRVVRRNRLHADAPRPRSVEKRAVHQCHAAPAASSGTSCKVGMLVRMRSCDDAHSCRAESDPRSPLQDLRARRGAWWQPSKGPPPLGVARSCSRTWALCRCRSAARLAAGP